LNVFENLLGAFQVAGTLILSPVLRPWYNRWGVTEEEAARSLPGDELVPDPRLGYTRAITIQTPPERVWPWLIQIGQGRGGLYSYDGLENLAGCDIHSAERIIQSCRTDMLEIYSPGASGLPGALRWRQWIRPGTGADQRRPSDSQPVTLEHSLG
jgi:hypothetical protein